MAERIVIPPAPIVYCPKDGEKVPIWYCLGSLKQGRPQCPYLVKATVDRMESAEVECKWETAINPEPPMKVPKKPQGEV